MGGHDETPARIVHPFARALNRLGQLAELGHLGRRYRAQLAAVVRRGRDLIPKPPTMMQMIAHMVGSWTFDLTCCALFFWARYKISARRQ